jgi:putative glutamine amidotransferase
VIGYTLELEDPMLPHVEPALREPLERFGAVTVVLPRSTPADRAEALLDLVDGVLLSGGADVHPRHCGEPVHELTRPIAEPHDEFEIALARAALDRGTPLLGICRGIQVMAVADVRGSYAAATRLLDRYGMFQLDRVNIQSACIGQ